jgi:hypothetical protein
MIIYNFKIDRPRRAFGPLEAYPPLVVDTDAVLALPVTLEGFQTISG